MTGESILGPLTIPDLVILGVGLLIVIVTIIMSKMKPPPPPPAIPEEKHFIKSQEGWVIATDEH